MRVDNSVLVTQLVALAERTEGGCEMFAAYFTVSVKPNDIEKFLEACLENAKASVRDEPDCYRFEMLRDKNDQNRICFIEVFKNEQAMEAHYETRHFSKLWQTTENMIDREMGETTMELIYSSDGALSS